MKITVDTNVLVRTVVHDDPIQAAVAETHLHKASVIAVSIPTFAIRALLDTENLAVNRPAAEAGLAILDAGGDFADGAIAHEGNWLGGEIFVSFDRQAVSLLAAQGQAATLL